MTGQPRRSVVEFVPGLVLDTEPSEDRTMFIGAILQRVPYVAGEAAEVVPFQIFPTLSLLPKL